MNGGNTKIVSAGKGILTRVISAEDDLDQEIISSTINMVVGLKLDSFLLDKKSYYTLFGDLISLTQSLLKSNSHVRKYVASEKAQLKDFEEKCLTDPNTVHLGLRPLELNAELEAALSDIKSALDALAQCFNPLLGVSLHGWHSKKNKESGRQVILTLQNNVPDRLSNGVGKLIEIIESNIPWLTCVVGLRDSARHHGGIKTVTDIVFNQNTKQVVPQLIMHKEAPEEVSKFIARTLKDITQFIGDCLVLAILAKNSSKYVYPEKSCRLLVALFLGYAQCGLVGHSRCVAK